MNRFVQRLWITRSWCGAIPVLLLLAGCAGDPTGGQAEGEADLEPVPVQVATAERTTLRPVLDLVGTTVAIPERIANISPQIGGWVTRLEVVEGQLVKAGDLLVQLDERAAQADLDRARAVVAEKEAALKLLKRGYLPQEIEAASRDRDKAKAAVEGVRGELAAMEEQ